MNNSLPPAVRQLCARYKSQRSSISSGATHEAHDLSSLARRVMLSREEVLQEVADGRLLALAGPQNNKYIFSSSSLDAKRNQVVSFVAESICTELARRGADEEVMLAACQRAFTRQFDFSRRPANIIEFAQTPDDDSFYGNAKKTAGTAAGLAAAAGAGYLGYRYLKNRRNADGTPQLPGSPGADGNYIDVTPKPPRDPNSSAEGIDVGSGNGRHPGAPSTSKAITTASSTTRRTVGNQVIDPLAGAVASGRQKIAQRGSRIWQALRGIRLE